jgi:hypothetical protein
LSDGKVLEKKLGAKLIQDVFDSQHFTGNKEAAVLKYCLEGTAKNLNAGWIPHT